MEIAADYLKFPFGHVMIAVALGIVSVGTLKCSRDLESVGRNS